MYHYVFSRKIYNETWTVEITPDDIVFSRHMVPHWDGTFLWDHMAASYHSKDMPRVRALRIAAEGFKSLRHVTGGLFTHAGQILYAGRP